MFPCLAGLPIFAHTSGLYDTRLLRPVRLNGAQNANLLCDEAV